MSGFLIFRLRRKWALPGAWEVPEGYRAGVLQSPKLKEATVAKRNVVGWSYGQAGGRAVDPFIGTFQFGEVADGRLIDDAVALALRPFGSPLLVAKGGNQAEGMKDLGQRIAVGDLGFSLDAVLVGVFSGANVGKALVGEEPTASVTADAKDLGAGAHLAVGCVIEDVALKAARSLQQEARGLEARGEGGKVVDAEFDFGLDGHG